MTVCPIPGTVTVTWSQDSGPGTVTFGNAHAASTTATFSTDGVYVLRLTANDGALPASDTVRVTVNPASSGGGNQAPRVSAGNSQTVTLPDSANLNGTVTDDGLPNPPGAVTVTWSMDSGPGTVIFGDAAQQDTTASFSTAGVYVLRLTADDGALTESATVTVTVNPEPVGSLPPTRRPSRPRSMPRWRPPSCRDGVSLHRYRSDPDRRHAGNHRSETRRRAARAKVGQAK